MPRQLRANAAMAARLDGVRVSAARIAERQEREHAAIERRSLRDGIDQAERIAAGQGEETKRTPEGGLEIVSRDGLKWLADRGRIRLAHAQAGLRFRRDYERANGTGVRSGLADMGAGAARSYGPGAGPTEAMLSARDAVRAALAAVHTPLLEKYVVLVAGEGRMLSDPAFTGGDSTRAREHHLACPVALDLLARHYGMVA